MDIARMVATRSTCDRAQVGGRHRQGQAYPSRRTIHAERNAISQCHQMGLDPKGATIYMTHSPCPICRRLIDEAGITRIVYDQEYGGIEEVKRNG